MKKNKGFKLNKKIGLIILVLFLFAVAAVEFVQSDWVKEKAKEMLLSALKESGYKVEIETLQGTFPQSIQLQGVSVQGNGIDLSIKTLEANLSLIRLLKKEIAFTLLKGEGIVWKKVKAVQIAETETVPSLPKIASLPKFSFAIYVEQFLLKDVSLPAFENAPLKADFKGRLRLSKKKSFLNISVKRAGFSNSRARLLAIVKGDGKMQLRVNVSTPTLDVFLPPQKKIANREDAQFAAELVASGPFAAFFGPAQGQLPVRGRISGSALPKNLSLPDPFKAWGERDWSFTANFSKNEILSFSKVSVNSNLFHIKGKASFNPDFQFSESNLQIVSEPLAITQPIPFSGRLFTQVLLKREADASLQAQAAWRFPLLTADGFKMENLKGSTTAFWKNEEFSGSTRFSGVYLRENWDAQTSFSWKPKGSLFLKEIEFKGPFLTGKGDLELRPDLLLTGMTEITVDNLQAVHIPDFDLYGSLQAKAQWKAIVEPGVSLQGLYFDILGKNIYYGPFSAQKVSLYSDLLDPFHTLNGNIDIAMEQARIGNLYLSNATLETKARQEEGENRPFHFFAEGKWKHPIEMSLDGNWEFENGKFSARVRDWKGSYFNTPFALNAPVELQWSSDLFRFENVAFTLNGSSITGSILRKEEETDASLKLNRVPIDFLSINPLEFPIAGSLTLETSIHEQKNRLKGELKATIDKMEAAETSPANQKLSAAGSFQGYFNNNRLELKGNLQARDRPYLDLDVSIPIHLSIWPFKSEFLPYMSAKGHVAVNGRIEDFLDFFDLGAHRLEGDCECDLSFSNTLNRPHLKGYGHFKNGLYQNYYSGTELTNIEANLQAEKEIVELKNLTAQDSSAKGKLTAEGKIAILPDDLFPFEFNVDFTRLNFVQIDMVTAEANGNIRIQGNATSALAKGTIEIVESELTIPDHIPRPVPTLQVVYKNATHPVLPAELSEYKPYPLFLDLHVSTPEEILIAGKGLHSLWTGDFDIGGTYSAILAKGKLELSKGEFSFGGRSFKLSEGSLSFSGKEHEMPNLDIAGTLDQKAVKITARLKGPLNNPQITFQSAPPLPLSSIMSYLLFGQNIGEITGFQALQLATSIASLAGQGPDIMESTRKALGVDRLRIIATPTEEGGETIALEVGTYVTEGVIVSLTQGAEDSSTNISVEVEIKDNFSFQAESQQQTEQGKFSLKWYVNY